MHLENKNPHPRDDLIKFYEKDHKYSHENKLFKSVTTILGEFSPKFDADKIIDKMMSSYYWKKNKYYGLTKEQIKKQWNNKKHKASKLGTFLHKNIEEYYNKINVSDLSPEWLHFLQFAKDHEHLKPFRTEWVVYDEGIGIAGTIDKLFKVDDEWYDMFDWKRTPEINKNKIFDYMTYPLVHLPTNNYYKYSLQQNFYKYILEKHYNIKIRNMYLVQLHPTLNQYILIKCENMQEEVKKIIKQLEEKDL